MQEIVLIYPIIRSNQTSAVEWHNLLDFFNHSSMSCLIVIDKTTSNIATKFFMHNFSQEDKDLFILARNRQDTAGVVTVKAIVRDKRDTYAGVTA